MQMGIAQLETLFASSHQDLQVLRALENELRYRQVPRAVALLAEVQGTLYSGSAGKPSTTSAPPELPRAGLGSRTSDLVDAVPPKQGALWEPPVSAPVTSASSTPAAKANPATVPDAPSVSLEEAYKVFRAGPGTGWESIEQARRDIVEMANPRRLQELPAAKRAQVQADARRANQAYRVVLSARLEA